jgi:hypothetical protein
MRFTFHIDSIHYLLENIKKLAVIKARKFEYYYISATFVILDEATLLIYEI